MAILNPYLSFRGDARAALEFYQSVFGGTLNISTFRDFGQMEGVDPTELDNVMHGQLTTDGNMTLMAADTPSSMKVSDGSSITLSLSGDDDTELRRYWEGLVAGASITMPLEKAPWGDTFGQLTDRFGVDWMMNITGNGQ